MKNVSSSKIEEKEVYLDACKTTRLDPQALKVMLPYFTEKYWYPGDFTSIGNEISETIQNSRKIVANSLNGNLDEIIFTTGGTDANNIAIKGIMYANRSKGKHFITSKVAHPTILTVFQALEKQGFTGTYISADKDGYLDLEQLKNSIRPDTTLVAFTHVNHTLGTIQKVKAISDILRKVDHKIYLFLDSCEAYSKIPIDVQEMGIDALSISAHKINGPKGIGALFVKKGTKISQTQHGILRYQPLKPGAINVPSIVGFGKEVELIFNQHKKYIENFRTLQEYFYKELLKKISDIQLNGPKIGERSPAHLNITFYYVEGEAIMMMLDFENIHIETGSACASKQLKPNYILRQTGRTHEECNSSLRFTFDKFVTKKDIERTVNVLEKVITELRRRSPLGKNKEKK